MATDDNDDTLTYTLEGTDAASFGIAGSTGQLSTSAALNYEAKSTYSVVVRASDPAGLSDTINVTINVTDVVEVVPEVPAIVQGYDTNDDGDISIAELFDAIDDYFAGTGSAYRRACSISSTLTSQATGNTDSIVGRRVFPWRTPPVKSDAVMYAADGRHLIGTEERMRLM